MQIPQDEGSSHDYPEVLAGLGTAEKIPAHEGGVHAAASVGEISGALAQVPPLTRSHSRSAGAQSRLLGATDVCSQDVGDCQDTVPRAQTHSTEEVQQD